MSLVALAQHCHDNSKTVYNSYGMSNVTELPIEIQRHIVRLHPYYCTGLDGGLYDLGSEGNVFFCLLVHEAANGKE